MEQWKFDTVEETMWAAKASNKATLLSRTPAISACVGPSCVSSLRGKSTTQYTVKRVEESAKQRQFARALQ
jgi:hypothetical protein